MSLTIEERGEYIEKFKEAETYYEKGRIAAEMWCRINDQDPLLLRAEILSNNEDSGNSPENRKELDRGGIAWCDEQLAARS